MDIRGQLVISGVALAGALFVFNYSQEQAKKQQEAVDKAKELGWNPNWVTGKPIESSQPVNTHDFRQPSCQVWDNDVQLFVNAGDKEADADQTKCWQKFQGDDSKQPRYIDKDGKLSFMTDDPFNEPQQNNGQCNFITSDLQIDTFPDIFGLIAPPNRSQRLCFASGTDSSEKPLYFVNQDGSIIFNPNYSAQDGESYLDSILATGTVESDRVVLAQDGTTDACEEQVTYNTATGPMKVWAETQTSSVFTDVDACLAANTGLPLRFRDATNKQLVYTNPFTGDKISTAIEAAN